MLVRKHCLGCSVPPITSKWNERTNVTGEYGWLMSKLPYYDKHNINVEAYDAFLKFHSRWMRRAPFSERYHYASLMLTHPVRRTADPMLEFFCRAESDGETMKVMNDVPLALLGIMIQILLQYCYSIGRMADVRRSLDFYYRVQ
jgi:hypothetical protein